MAVDLEKYRKASATTTATDGIAPSPRRIDLSKYKAAPAPASEQGGFGAAVAEVVKAPIRSLLAKPVARTTEALGRVGLFGKTIKRGYEAMADEGQALKTPFGEIPQVGSGKQAAKKIIGEGLETAAYLFPYGKAARSVLPAVSAIPKVAPGAAKTVSAATSGAAGGYAFDVGSKLQEGKNIAEAAKPGAGTAVGAALPVVAGIVGGVASKLASRTPEKRIVEMKDSLRTLQNAYSEGVRYHKVDGKTVERSNPIKTIVDLKIRPEVVNDRVNAEPAIKRIEDEIAGLAQSRKADVALQEQKVPLAKLLDEAKAQISGSKELRTSGAVKPTLKKLETIFDDFKSSFGDDVPLETVDDIRITMNKRYDPELRDAFRAVGDAARKIVYEGHAPSRATLLREGELIAARDFLEAMNGRVVKGGRLGNYMNRILGAIVGGLTSVPVLGAPLGALGFDALGKAIRSQYFNPKFAKTGQAVSKAVGKATDVIFKEKLQKFAPLNASRQGIPLNVPGKMPKIPAKNEGIFRYTERQPGGQSTKLPAVQSARSRIMR